MKSIEKFAVSNSINSRALKVNGTRALFPLALTTIQQNTSRSVVVFLQGALRYSLTEKSVESDLINIGRLAALGMGHWGSMLFQA